MPVTVRACRGCQIERLKASCTKMVEPSSRSRSGLVISGRVIPVPRTVSAEAQAFLARPVRKTPDYPSASDKAAWRELIDVTAHGHAAFWATQGAEHPAEVVQIPLGHSTLYEITPHNLQPEDAGHALLYVHGGAFIFGGGEAAMHAAKQVAGVARLTTYAIDYRMPPDHPFPAGLHDTVEAYRWLLQQYLPANIAVYGISAGGNIAPAALLELGYQGLPLPAACAVHSPCADLTEGGDSYETNRDIDAVLQQRFPEPLKLYAGGHDPRDPLLSPAFAQYDSSFPPTILSTGTRDLLLSSTVMLHRAMRRGGVEAELHVFEAMPHAPFFGAPEELELLDEQIRFIRRHLGSGNRAPTFAPSSPREEIHIASPRDQIADLVHMYAYHVRHRIMDGAEDLFVPDVEFIIREQNKTARGTPSIKTHLIGRDETLDYLHRSSATMALCPLIHNLLIEVDGTTARSTCVMENRTWPAIPGLIGEYEDSFEFAGRWRFAKRMYTMFLD